MPPISAYNRNQAQKVNKILLKYDFALSNNAIDQNFLFFILNYFKYKKVQL